MTTRIDMDWLKNKNACLEWRTVFDIEYPNGFEFDGDWAALIRAGYGPVMEWFRSTLLGYSYSRPPTDMRGADLKDARLYGAALIRIDFSDADLSGANCAEASFRRCTFKGAKLNGALFANASFEDCDLTGAIIDDATNFYNVRFWGDTLVDDEFDIESPPGDEPSWDRWPLRIQDLIGAGGFDGALRWFSDYQMEAWNDYKYDEIVNDERYANLITQHGVALYYRDTSYTSYSGKHIERTSPAIHIGFNQYRERHNVAFDGDMDLAEFLSQQDDNKWPRIRGILNEGATVRISIGGSTDSDGDAYFTNDYDDLLDELLYEGERVLPEMYDDYDVEDDDKLAAIDTARDELEDECAELNSAFVEWCRGIAQEVESEIDDAYEQWFSGEMLIREAIDEQTAYDKDGYILGHGMGWLYRNPIKESE